MSPRQRVEISLRGGHCDRVPFTIYECMIPQCTAERLLRNRSLCIVQRAVNVVKSHRPNVEVRQEIFTQDGKRLTRHHIRTPAGGLTMLTENAGFTTWYHQRMFKSPDDYKAILAYIRDEQVEENYAAFLKAQENLGEDFILRAGLALEPLQELISGQIMDMEVFCLEWMERRDEVLKLYEAIRENRRKRYPIVAQSPALFANYGGNVVAQIIGLETFQKYYLPDYNEAAEILHKHGKLLGSHFDDDCKLLAPAIARTDLDYIEAFTPFPGSDMTLAEARQAWPNKVLWINFPSSQHLKSDAEVEAITVDLLEQVPTMDGLIVGITEDMPPDRWQQSCTAIMDGLDRHARQQPQRYC